MICGELQAMDVLFADARRDAIDRVRQVFAFS
jgi:hypothetical protein